MEDSDYFFDFINNLDSNTKNIDIIIYSSGGNIYDNNIYLHLIIKLSEKYNINTYVYNYAASAGTLLFFAGNNLFMDNYAFITPTDPQIPLSNNDYHQSADIILNGKDKKNINFKNKILINSTERSYKENIKIVKILLKKHMPTQKINRSNYNRLLNILTTGRISHSTPIGKDFLESNGLKINKIPTELKNILIKIFDYI
jgi:ClpP class serine protease